MTATPAPNPAEKTLPAHVLVVEDDALLGLSLETVLQDAGVSEVELCQTTEQALEALRRKRPDAIVLDVHLADRDDGWALAELLQSLGPASPQIVFSTGAPDDIPEDIANLGTVLAKPYAPEALVDALREPAREGLMSRLRRKLR